jgi:hypothetical protein
MCTASIIPLGHAATPHLAGEAGFRVVVSRDEQRDRPPALQPRWRTIGGGRAIWPIDPRGGGTWIGAGEHGLVLMLLNVNPEPPPTLPPGLASRGMIIPRLIDAPTPDAALARLRGLDLERFAPFRVIAAGPDHAGRAWRGGVRLSGARWDRDRLTTEPAGPGPACFVSSGLGDSHAHARLGLFRDVVAGAPAPEAQDEFHDHAWPGREDVSVRMSRTDARTVSVTYVEVRPRAGGGVQVRMSYRPVYEAREAAAISR